MLSMDMASDKRMHDISLDPFISLIFTLVWKRKNETFPT